MTPKKCYIMKQLSLNELSEVIEVRISAPHKNSVNEYPICIPPLYAITYLFTLSAPRALPKSWGRFGNRARQMDPRDLPGCRGVSNSFGRRAGTPLLAPPVAGLQLSTKFSRQRRCRPVQALGMATKFSRPFDIHNACGEGGVGERVRFGSPTAKAAGAKRSSVINSLPAAFCLPLKFSDRLFYFLTPFHLGSLKEKSLLQDHFFFRLLSASPSRYAPPYRKL